MDKMPFMGLEIINNTPETQSLQFFGMAHRHHIWKSNLSIRTIFGDTVYEDKEMSLITHFLQDYHSLRIYATMFHTSLLYGAFNGKRFSVTVHGHRYDGCESRSFDLSKYTRENNPTRADLHEVFGMNFFAECEQTGIEAGERLLILFDLGNRNFHMQDAVEKANKLYGSEKRRKILLTI